MSFRLPVRIIDTRPRPKFYGVGLVADLATGAPDFSIEIERAADNGSGAPDTGTAATAGILEPGTSVFFDELPNDNTLRHWRARYVRSGWTSGSWTDWVGAKPVPIYRTPTDRPAQVYSAQVERLSDGTFTVFVDSHSGVKSVKVAWTANPAQSTPAVGTGAAVATDAAGSVDITDLVNVAGSQVPSETEPTGGWAGPLKVRVTFYSGTGATGNILGSVRTVDEYGVEAAAEGSNWVRGTMTPVKSGDGYKLQVNVQVGAGTQKVRYQYNEPSTGNLEPLAGVEVTIPGTGIRNHTFDIQTSGAATVVYLPTDAYPDMVVFLVPLDYSAGVGALLTLDEGSVPDVGVGTVRVKEGQGGTLKVIQTLEAASGEGITIATGGVLKAKPADFIVRSATDPGFSGADDDGKIWFQP